MPIKMPIVIAAMGLMLAGASAPLLAAAPAIVKVDLGEDGKMEYVRLDRTTVHAGQVIFEVSNSSPTEEHELIVVKTKLTPAQFPTSKDGSKVTESRLKGAKELGDIKPGKSGKLTMAMTPGHYVLYCNFDGHFHDGMYTELTVTP